MVHISEILDEKRVYFIEKEDEKIEILVFISRAWRTLKLDSSDSGNGKFVSNFPTEGEGELWKIKFHSMQSYMKYPYVKGFVDDVEKKRQRQEVVDVASWLQTARDFINLYAARPKLSESENTASDKRSIQSIHSSKTSQTKSRSKGALK